MRGVAIFRLLTPFVVFLPFSTSYQTLPPDSSDSSWTSIGLGGGTLNYRDVTRGCDNSILSSEKREASVYGGEIEHKFASGSLVGLRFTRVEETRSYVDRFGQPVNWTGEMTLWNPHVGLDFRKFAIGAGYNFIQDELEGYTPSPVSGHLRFGRRDGTTFNLVVSEGAPLWNPGGVGEARIDFPVTRRARLGVGVAFPVPYDAVGLVARGRVALVKDLYLTAAGRIGDGGGGTENAVTFGLSWTPFHSRPRPSHDAQGPVPADSTADR